MYLKYLLYLLEHKKNVGIECIKEGLYLHAITHDLSKFLPSEFLTYAKFFHSKNRTKKYNTSDETDINFLKGRIRHQKRNKHHWNYWVSVTRWDKIEPIPMPMKHVRQMICDWRGMARKFGGTWTEYYQKNKKSFIMHKDTITLIENFIGD